MTKAYKYGGPCIGSYDTRHEAIGAAAILGREDGDIREAPFTGPKDVLFLVRPHPTVFCGYCGVTFDNEEELAEHKPCPAWEKDKPIPSEGGHNPIEAARMTRYGL